MSIFQEIGISWKGNEYVVPADKVMGLIVVVEDIITMEELSGDGIKRGKLSKAFCAAVDYAGGNADCEEVYSTFFNISEKNEISGIINCILGLMIPPEHLANNDDGEDVGKSQATPEDS